MAKQVSVSIIGGTIWGNRGAEAMLVTSIGKLRETFPNAHFNVFSYYPAKDRELINDSRITILSGKPVSLATRHFFGALLGMLIKKGGGSIPKNEFFKISRALAESDVLLDIGGITFSDGREKYLPFNILTIWPAMMLGVAVVKMAQAVGPFQKAMNRALSKHFLMRCRKVFARGKKTVEYLQFINFPREKYESVADIAFLYQPEYSLSRENEAQADRLISRLEKTKEAGKKVIVFSPSILVETESQKKQMNYSSRFLDVIKKLGGSKYHYVFMPNATREGSDKEHNNDLLTIERIKAAWEGLKEEEEKGACIDWVNYDINTVSIRRIIHEADVLVTSRYHAMISGLCLAIPTIVIGWGHKYKETMAAFNLEAYSLDFETANQDLGGMILNTIANSESIRAEIRKNLSDVRRSAQKQFDYLNQELA